MKIIFICLGNICRSPAAEGVFRSIAACCGTQSKFEIESRATGSWHLGLKPDERMIKALQEISVHLDVAKKAQLLSAADLMSAEYLFCADKEIASEVLDQQAQLPHQAKKAVVCLMTVYSKQAKNSDVPDPFYGNEADFAQVVGILKEACQEMHAVLSAKVTA